MSKIPVHAKNNSRRSSIAKPDSIKQYGEMRRPLSRLKNNQYSSQNTPNLKNMKSDIFKSQPTMSYLNGRSLPPEILGKKIYGNPEALNSLFRYLKSITQPYFLPEFHNLVFPKTLSTIHQITVNKFETKKNAKKNPRSSIAVANEITYNDSKTRDIDLSPVFDKFQVMILKQKNLLFCLTDFILLYCAYLLIVLEGNAESEKAPLFFLKQFLMLDFPKRKHEIDILSSVLLKQADAAPIVRGHSLEALNLLVKHDNSVLNRIKSGCEYHDKTLSDFCKECLNFYNRSSSKNNELPPPPTFSLISPNANENVCNEMLSSYLSAFENGEKPRDLALFINNIVQTMQRFARSAPILEKGSNIIGVALNFLQPPPIEVVSEVINLCYSILSGESFLTGNDSFDALEAIQSLSNNIFEIVPCDVLLPAINATVATSTDSLLRLLMKKLSEYYQNHRDEINQRQLNEIASSLDAFHPDFNERPPFLNINFGQSERLATMTESIERLLNPETVFIEMESLIEQDPAILNDYPLYLRGFLQRAYFLYHNEVPDGMSDDQRQLAESMSQEMKLINNEDLVNGGKYSVEVLTAQLEEMKAYNNSSW